MALRSRGAQPRPLFAGFQSSLVLCVSQVLFFTLLWARYHLNIWTYPRSSRYLKIPTEGTQNSQNHWQRRTVGELTHPDFKTTTKLQRSRQSSKHRLGSPEISPSIWSQLIFNRHQGYLPNGAGTSPKVWIWSPISCYIQLTQNEPKTYNTGAKTITLKRKHRCQFLWLWIQVSELWSMMHKQPKRNSR